MTQPPQGGFFIYHWISSHAGNGFAFCVRVCEFRLETAMSDRPEWLDGPTEVDFYRGITDHAPGAKESAISLAAVGLGYMYGFKKAKKKKK